MNTESVQELFVNGVIEREKIFVRGSKTEWKWYYRVNRVGIGYRLKEAENYCKRNNLTIVRTW